MRLVLLGAPGSGKGTQAARLQGAPAGAAHLHRRPAARRGRRRQRRWACRPRTVMARGDLVVSDDIVLGMLEERLARADTAQRLHSRRLSAQPGPGRARWTTCWRASASRWTRACSWTSPPTCWSNASPAAPPPKAAPTTRRKRCASACRGLQRPDRAGDRLLPPARPADRGQRRRLAGRVFSRLIEAMSPANEVGSTRIVERDARLSAATPRRSRALSALAVAVGEPATIGHDKLHILGIAGTFMGGVAALARELGHAVEGSDQSRLSADVHAARSAGHRACRRATRREHRRRLRRGRGRQRAVARQRRRSKQVLDARPPTPPARSGWREHVLPGRDTLAVAGTHGKTTTTTILAYLLRGGGPRARLPDRRRAGGFRRVGAHRRRRASSWSRPTNTTPRSSTSAASSCTTGRWWRSSTTSSTTTPTSSRTSPRSSASSTTWCAPCRAWPADRQRRGRSAWPKCWRWAAGRRSSASAIDAPDARLERAPGRDRRQRVRGAPRRR